MRGNTYEFSVVLEEDAEFGLNGLEGDLVEVQVPGRWEICDTCRGNGTHVNRNIDGNGITSEMWADWEPEEREGYFGGHYDVPCEADCWGGKVMVPDEERCTWEQKALLERHYEDERGRAQDEAAERHLRRMEAYACGERD